MIITEANMQMEGALPLHQKLWTQTLGAQGGDQKADVLTLPLIPCSQSSSAEYGLGLARSCLIWLLSTFFLPQTHPSSPPAIFISNCHDVTYFLL